MFYPFLAVNLIINAFLKLKGLLISVNIKLLFIRSISKLFYFVHIFSKSLPNFKQKLQELRKSVL